VKRIIVITGLFLAGLLLLAGCAGQKNTVKAKLGKEFILAIGQQASIGTEKMTVAFRDITQDSRCPSDVVCIQAGNVTAAVDLTINGAVSNITLKGNTGNATQQVDNYTFAFNVTPYPVSTHQIEKSEYRLYLTVTK